MGVGSDAGKSTPRCKARLVRMHVREPVSWHRKRWDIQWLVELVAQRLRTMEGLHDAVVTWRGLSGHLAPVGVGFTWSWRTLGAMLSRIPLSAAGCLECVRPGITSPALIGSALCKPGQPYAWLWRMSGALIPLMPRMA